MDTLQELDLKPTEQEKLDKWRAKEFARLGFDEHQAELLVSHDVSPHDAARLTDIGCPHSTALLILI